MTKDEFMKELGRSLNKLPAEEREEILQDFEEHFAIGCEEGKSEQEIAEALGSPDQIAREMNATRKVGKASNNATPHNILRATWAVIGLSFFNLIIVLGPFLGIIGLVIGGWAISFSFTVSPLLALFGLAFGDSTMFDFSASLALCGIGLLFGIIMYYLTKWIFIGFIRYLQFNISLVKGGMKNEDNE